MSASDWRDRAACVSADPEAFFPEHGAPYADYAMARHVCETCPVLAECRTWILAEEDGMGFGSRFGMFAGMTPMQRWKYRDNDAKPTNRGGRQAIAPCGTVAAYKRHIRNHEPTDAACRQAMADESSTRRNPVYRSRRADIAIPEHLHGTNQGYRRHLAHGEKACLKCQEARAAARRAERASEATRRTA